MKEAFVSNPTGDNIVVSIKDSPIPTPNDTQVVIRVVASALNPKDWKIATAFKDKPSDQGDDVAGYIHSVGSKVTEFKPGDRVAAFHEMVTPHGGYAEYTLAWASTTFHIPKETSFEGPVSIPRPIFS
jgi:NADPH:quinone reductase-like Zn-dependent oxidoreductase